MMSNLYPLTFHPRLFPKVWGGHRLRELLGKGNESSENCGESWELSAFDIHDSVVSNGFLAGNTLSELIEVYMGSLVGDSVYEKYGSTFPLLIKFIDASQNLSLQVHPGDMLAWERHQSFGKSEMWYVMDATPEAQIFAGFNSDTNPNEVSLAIGNNTLEKLLNHGVVRLGDVFHIEPGTVHAIGAGVVLAEIQQASDVTYRLYDWGRLDERGIPRDLHIDQAKDAICYEKSKHFSLPYQSKMNSRAKLVNDKNFTVNLIECNKPIDVDYFSLDSFVVLLCTQGKFKLNHSEGSLHFSAGEVVLIPAECNRLELNPQSDTSKVLEIYLEGELL